MKDKMTWDRALVLAVLPAVNPVLPVWECVPDADPLVLPAVVRVKD